MQQMNPVSRRYAEAFAELTLALSDAERQQVRQQLTALSQAIGSSPDLENVLQNPAIRPESRRKVLDALLKELGAHDSVARFVRLIAERGRADVLRDIIFQYCALDDARQGVVHGKLTSAAELPDQAVDKIKRALEKRTGKKVDLEVLVDPELIGGVRAEVGSMVFDGTIRSELERLRETLEATQ
jgi:F-type H+-transporting ATPase subunit delta